MKFVSFIYTASFICRSSYNVSFINVCGFPQVTGAGRGLGRGLALQFAKEGCSVAVADINRSAADETAAEITAAGGVAKVYLTIVTYYQTKLKLV